MVNSYHLSLINGATNAAQHFDVNQIIYMGDTLHSPVHNEEIRNIIYNYINNNMLDGLIIAAACIGGYAGRDKLTRFLDQFKPLPMVTMTEKIQDIPCIKTDNSKGLKELIHHLIYDHHYKHIGFIKGTSGNVDAAERFHVFKQTLKEEGREVNPDIILDGSFTFESGIDAVLELINHRKGPCDVLVAANDDMACGAISALQSRGIHVPEEIAVVGYDNQESGECIIPLTTVAQPVYKQSWKAMELLISMIKGNRSGEDILLRTAMVKRQSCGCTGTMEKSFSYSKDIRASGSSFADISVLKQKINEIYGKFQINTQKDRNQIQVLFNSLLTSIQAQDPVDFFKEINHILNSPFTFIHRNYSFTRLFSEIRSCILEYVTSYQERAFMEYLFSRVFFQFAERFERNIKYSKMVGEREIHASRINLEDILTILDMENPANGLSGKLSLIGIKGCYLSLYENEQTLDCPVMSRLVFASNDEGCITIKDNEKLFPGKNLCPETLLPWQRQFTITVESLFVGRTPLGFCLLEFEEQPKSLQEITKKMFTIIALKIVIYIQKLKIDTQKYEKKVNTRTDALSRANDLLTRLYGERKQAEEEVRRLNEELELRVRDRTAQLESAYNRLQDTLDELTVTQSKLVQSKKMAALGGLVAGIAHEINTPIGIGVTAASHLERETEELVKLMEENSLKKSDLNNYIKMANEASSLVLTNLKRAHELIKSFKKIAVDQSSEDKRRFMVKAYLEEILISLKPKLKKTAHIIKIDCKEAVELYSYPGAFSQVVTNLIINSLVHGFDNDEQGKIVIKCTLFRNNFILRYFDNGKGIKKDFIDRIFEPFFTTNRITGGTGLGLNLVYNIVTQTFKGTIRVRSRPGYGVLFKITIPINT
ncbi:MAG: substrate-binding domain-containing protein [Spirochaetales bacterium]|nr:substrate-binding domain-containing protein [Spirochaetales bacterium]